MIRRRAVLPVKAVMAPTPGTLTSAIRTSPCRRLSWFSSEVAAGVSPSSAGRRRLQGFAGGPPAAAGFSGTLWNDATHQASGRRTRTCSNWAFIAPSISSMPGGTCWAPDTTEKVSTIATSGVTSVMWTTCWWFELP